MTIKEFDIQCALGSLSNDIKRNLANNPNTPIKILVILSTDKYYTVRCRVADNPNTPTEILIKLSKDEDWAVRSRVADNPNTPKKLQWKVN